MPSAGDPPVRHARGWVGIHIVDQLVHGIALQKLEITTEGDIDLRGLFGLDPAVAAGYRELQSRVVIKGDGTEEQFRKIHNMVLATSPNFYNITQAVRVAPELTVE